MHIPFILTCGTVATATPEARLSAALPSPPCPHQNPSNVNSRHTRLGFCLTFFSSLYESSLCFAWRKHCCLCRRGWRERRVSPGEGECCVERTCPWVSPRSSFFWFLGGALVWHVHTLLTSLIAMSTWDAKVVTRWASQAARKRQRSRWAPSTCVLDARTAVHTDVGRRHQTVSTAPSFTWVFASKGQIAPLGSDSRDFAQEW